MTIPSSIFLVAKEVNGEGRRGLQRASRDIAYEDESQSVRRR